MQDVARRLLYRGNRSPPREMEATVSRRLLDRDTTTPSFARADVRQANYIFRTLNFMPSALILYVGDEIWQLCHGGMDTTHTKMLLDWMNGNAEASTLVAGKGEDAYIHSDLKWADFANKTAPKSNRGAVIGYDDAEEYMETLHIARIISGHQDKANFTYFSKENLSGKFDKYSRWYNGPYVGGITLDTKNTAIKKIQIPPECMVITTSSATMSRPDSQYLSKATYLRFEGGDALTLCLIDVAYNNTEQKWVGPTAKYGQETPISEVVNFVNSDQFKYVRKEVPPDDLDSTCFFDREVVEETMKTAQLKYRESKKDEFDVYYEMVRADSGILIGDLHGSIDSLCKILDDVKHFFDADMEILQQGKHIVFLGDLVDRSPYSIEILVLAFRLKNKNWTQVHILNGNHETAQIFNSYNPGNTHPIGLAEEADEEYANEEEEEEEEEEPLAEKADEEYANEEEEEEEEPYLTGSIGQVTVFPDAVKDGEIFRYSDGRLYHVRDGIVQDYGENLPALHTQRRVCFQKLESGWTLERCKASDGAADGDLPAPPARRPTRIWILS